MMYTALVINRNTNGLVNQQTSLCAEELADTITHLGGYSEEAAKDIVKTVGHTRHLSFSDNQGKRLLFEITSMKPAGA